MGLFNLFRNKNPYPKNMDEVLDDNIQYSDAVIEVLTKFKKNKPWRGDQKAKFTQLNKDLAKAFKINTPELFFAEKYYPSCQLTMAKKYHAIILSPEADGRYSVHVFLHEFAHVILGGNEKKVCRWATNLFRKIFPKSYGNLQADGHLLYKKT